MAELPAAVRAVRPRQWVKNGLVLAAPLAAGRASEPDVLGATALAFVAYQERDSWWPAVQSGFGALGNLLNEGASTPPEMPKE